MRIMQIDAVNVTAVIVS